MKKAKKALRAAGRQQRPDLVLLLSALVYGRARWEPLGANSGEVCVRGLRYLTCTDVEGCPIVNAPMRDALIAATILSGEGRPQAPLGRRQRRPLDEKKEE